MAVIVDSHTFLWTILDDPRLSTQAREIVENPNVPLFLSQVSAWELTLKISKGKLDLNFAVHDLFTTELERFSIRMLPVEVAHLSRYVSLESVQHKDPWDRMIVAQCLVEEFALVSVDAKLDEYGVTRIW